MQQSRPHRAEGTSKIEQMEGFDIRKKLKVDEERTLFKVVGKIHSDSATCSVLI
jgi:hypothetical protein